MKRFLFLLSMSLCIFCISAQNEQGQQRSGRNQVTIEERAKRTTEWMKEALNLSEEQVAPVDSINLLYTKAQQVLFKSAEDDREKIREALTALEAQKVEALEKVLTEEQVSKYKKESEKRQKQRSRNGENRRSRR